MKTKNTSYTNSRISSMAQACKIIVNDFMEFRTIWMTNVRNDDMKGDNWPSYLPVSLVV